MKCHQYWPSYGTTTYGNVQVTLKEVENLAEYSIRTFNVSPVSYLAAMFFANTFHDSFLHASSLLVRAKFRCRYVRYGSSTLWCGQIMGSHNMPHPSSPSIRGWKSTTLTDGDQWWSTAGEGRWASIRVGSSGSVRVASFGVLVGWSGWIVVEKC